ncbi:hypothetical protein [Reyranella sp.]|uniref:hypothetical protein n=1 Tax=Reyranella sp. TaxID=1929291 RepID=UPI003D125B39
MDWLDNYRTERLWWTTVAVLVLLLAATAVVSLADRRVLDGDGVWAKPLKFELALALHFATLALIMGSLGEAWRQSTGLWWVAIASAACTSFEMAYILVQAGRQQASHFNLATPFLAAMYGLMAAGAVVITVAAAVVGAVALIDGDARLGPATRLGIGLGLIGGTILTLVIAFRMGGALDHHVGREPAGAPRLPLTGWSLAVGDRRVPHFFATHMMQALPLAGLGFDWLLPRLTATIAMLTLAAGWTAITLFFFHQANSGTPFHRWPN